MTTFTTDDRLHAEKDGSFTIDCRLKPLTKEQIDALSYLTTDIDPEQFVRAIEEAHGIR
jgi:hypothetical protein